MEGKKNVKNKWLHLRLDEAEHRQLMTQFKGTTERRLSSYVRKILLGKPMIKGVRDTAIQDILAVLFQLQKDLNGIGNNYNQMVKRLHVLDDKQELSAWLKRYEKERGIIQEALHTVREYVQQTAAKWLQ